MTKFLRKPWFYFAMAVAVILLFFSTITHEDVRLKQHVISGAAFSTVEPGMLFTLFADFDTPTSLCRLHDPQQVVVAEQHHNRVFYNWIGRTVPVVPHVSSLLGFAEVPAVEIPLAYTIKSLDPDFRGEPLPTCEERAIRAIEQHGETICVVDAVVKLDNEKQDLFGVRFKLFAFAPNWTDWEHPPKCRLATSRGGLLPIRQVFIGDRIST